jgi:hypothetical protein
VNGTGAAPEFTWANYLDEFTWMNLFGLPSALREGNPASVNGFSQEARLF